MLLRCWPTFGVQFDQVWSMSAKTGPLSARSAIFFSDRLAQRGPQFRKMLGRLRANFTDPGPNSTQFGRFRPKSGRHPQLLTEFDHIWAEFDQIWLCSTNFEPKLSNLGESWAGISPNSAKLRPNCGTPRRGRVIGADGLLHNRVCRPGWPIFSDRLAPRGRISENTVPKSS